MKLCRTLTPVQFSVINLRSSFATRIIAWYQKHGRYDLPWQNTHDPYRIWLSEIMLQQTQVSRAISYYTRFLKYYPDVNALAAASLDEIMALWSGLGYYSRAHNLYYCAQIIVKDHKGIFPIMPNELSKLPGIGRSTAAAIAAFAYGSRVAILDGNVKRVLSRIFGVDGFLSEKHIENEMWMLAELLLPIDTNDNSISSYTQGIMDFGATLCISRKPNCINCPFIGDCVAQLTGRQLELPAVRPKKKLPIRKTWMLLLCKRDMAVLLERRPPIGIWCGLWSLPEADTEMMLIKRALQFGGELQLIPLTPITHIFTHFRLEIELRLSKVDNTRPSCSEYKKYSSNIITHKTCEMQTAWVYLNSIDRYGMPAPIRKLLNSILTGAFKLC
ncbi:MAG: A/G-specific adenine glycosylase [Burkholderia sp.]|nr:A/G-specific adenine glycosylase [Burkholderia sp.]